MSSESATVKGLGEFEKKSQLHDGADDKLGSDSFDVANGDDALRFVGVEAKEHFRKEYDRKLQRKLVFKHVISYKIVYLLLGALAIVIGIVVLILLPDSPVHAHMLTREERIAVLERKTIKKEKIREAHTDVRTWMIVLSTVLTSIPNGASSNFSNIIIKTLGYTHVAQRIAL
ncbi:hypothetical protein PAXRUDRAFT_9342 [Paxillus rubicundulus Ve08.2h10]|uniref:Uncharacterized protein n=1 Tax=Paxillus rubicundulus Ve08.2h10 TaxID=930991 RepID=A0A0D0E3H6_9AGAM|nr:hypothetical protein PAXRUDRAFT_9342 [Paxillus rubicundulus Ve08.2h10]